MVHPNLFDFATSELSQDAFFCWLLAWADARYSQEDPALHRAGRSLLNALLAKHDERLSETSSVQIKQQHYRADIVAEIDNRLVLLIEDKIHALLHGNQLERYRVILTEQFPHCKVLPTFVRTGDQSGYTEIEAAGYRPFLRQDLLHVLRTERRAGLTNAIFIDFLEQLEKREALVHSYADRPIRDWFRDSWIGFYKQLQLELPGLSWDYVPNPSGGFLGAWWYFKKWEDCDVYLQLEQGPLCFKISVTDKSRASDMRDRWHKELIAAAKRLTQSLPLVRPKRFGRGWTMTVALVEPSAWMVETSDRLLDMVGTLSNLRVAEQLLEAARLSTLMTQSKQ
jgi:hypothetical protein